MKQHIIPRIMIAAAGSGSGKTSITCGLLQALLNKKKRLASFKCGPDYIDPMFHSEVLGIKSRNLDLFFMEENAVNYLLCKNAKEADFAVIEGVMGYYDGLAGNSTECSSYDLARVTKTPVILVADCKGMSVSVVALIKGFVEFREDSNIQGILLNRIPAVLFDDTKKLIQEEIGVPVLGYLPTLKDCSLESRHLGLITAQEIGNLKEIIDKLAEQITDTVDLDKILQIGQEAPPIGYETTGELQVLNSIIKNRNLDLSRDSHTDCTGTVTNNGDGQLKCCQQPHPHNTFVKIAVAMDKAFCFYYQDNLDLLEELGAEILPFSPLEDKALPAGAQGLILGGGYPELYLEQLSGNQGMLQSIKSGLEAGMPCIAECGGFMYLNEIIRDEKGKSHKMVGAMAGESLPTDKLTRFGYLSLVAKEDNILCKAGETLRGHEFHYWDSTNCGSGFIGKKPRRERVWDCVVASDSLYAGYPHIHYYSNIKAAENFIKKVEMTEL